MLYIGTHWWSESPHCSKVVCLSLTRLQTISFCHLSPSGGRIGKNGKEVVPPAGVGAYEAFQKGPESDRDNNVDMGTIAKPKVAEAGNTGPTGDHSLTDQVVGLSVDDAKAESARADHVGIPVVETSEGAPESPDVVFDHAPSTEEKEQAQALIKENGLH